MIRYFKMYKERALLVSVVVVMAVFFLLSTPAMNDDGFHYEGFAESLARGKLDFKSFYGFQGLSFFAVPIFWITGSDISIIITSMFFVLLSVPLAYSVGRDYFGNKRAGFYFLTLFLLMPYPYTTLMRGFQESALLFFILLIIYAAINRKSWVPVAWAIGGIVKPFAIVLFPLFAKNLLTPPGAPVDKRHRKSFIHRGLWWFIGALVIGGLYLGASYYQTGHLINNAAINSYQGNFDTGNPPELVESFAPSVKGFLRVGANTLLHFRKIMVSPFVIILGALVLWYNKRLFLRKEIMAAIILNILLVGSLTFSFPKYLLPMTTLFALASVSYLLKHRWLIWLVLVDSFFVFYYIWDFFGYNYWDNIYVYLLPFWAAITVAWFVQTRIKSELNNGA